jgi:hypothetical protein
LDRWAPSGRYRTIAPSKQWNYAIKAARETTNKHGHAEQREIDDRKLRPAHVGFTAGPVACGIVMAPFPVLLVGGTLVAALTFAYILDLVMVPLFGRLGIAQSPRDHQPIPGPYSNP